MSIHRVLLASLALTCVGCVSIEEKMELRQDGSGRLQMEVGFPQLAMRWLPGKPDANWLRPNLPDGVRLTAFKNSQRKTALTDADGKQHQLVGELYKLDFVFDKATALNGVRVRPDTRNTIAAAAGAAPGKTSREMAGGDIGPASGPFQQLTLTKDGDLLHFRRVVQAARDPADIESDTMSTPGSAARPKSFDLGNSTLRISIACPGEVVDHNAHRVDGRTLTWEFKLQQLQERQDRDWVVKFTCRREGE